MLTPQRFLDALPAELRSVVQQAAERLRDVPPRLRRIVRAMGNVPKAIAKQLRLSEKSVRTYINDLYRRLGLRENSQAYPLERTVIVMLAVVLYTLTYGDLL
ncbi:LuxR C-terminal-related transcriptional regulator [Chloroflexus sp.]|uniref:LuxR C-terminal-related transcriptional regulator n=1 Tax=Chloroflexus sp. TaxID=1904827 RepID=UPI002ACE4E2C|nr:LuxR C-terminal-related transcriptional regulator [Chloroflexus sp.]